VRELKVKYLGVLKKPLFFWARETIISPWGRPYLLLSLIKQQGGVPQGGRGTPPIFKVEEGKLHGGVVKNPHEWGVRGEDQHR